MTAVLAPSVHLAVQQDGERTPSLLCWRCGSVLGPLAPQAPLKGDTHTCDHCNAQTQRSNGIWLSLSPDRSEYFSRFIADYEFIRAAEGRGSFDANYYLALPFKDLSGRNSAQWAIRSRTFRTLESQIIAPLAARLKRPLRILDLGAGNGWMSYRLARAGHSPVAVDLLVNQQDGLGAALHYERVLQNPFSCVQAELDRLPFASSTFDCVIFNASFHYSEDYEKTLAEAFRCARDGGVVVIADTAWYAEETSGMQMVDEKHRHFAAKFGFPSNSIRSLEYLTPSRLSQLAARFRLHWQVLKPFYGLRWALRPLLAKLQGKRPPSRFRIFAAWVKR